MPGLAESWKRLNPTTWQFALRKGVKFHNGDDFNADSVKFTLDRATNPETKATISSELSTIAATEIVDPFTVNVITKTPDFLLPVRLGELYGLMLSPKHTDRRGQGGHRHQAERDRPVQAGRVDEERAAGARGQRAATGAARRR